MPEPGSLMYKVLNNYCLLCNESAVDDGLSRFIPGGADLTQGQGDEEEERVEL